MWLEGGRLEQLDAALGAGRPTDIDRLLVEIQTYPDLDLATKQAVESHLCQFDPI